MTILANATVVVKPVCVTLPWAWGFQDGATGVSWAEGFGLFAGARLTQYLAGHKAGKQAAARKAMRTAQVAPTPTNWFTRPDAEFASMPADFAQALEDVAEHGIRYARPLDHDAIEAEVWGS